jgi:hypothetical protein
MVSDVVEAFIMSEEDWGRYLSKYTGFSLRRGLSQQFKYLEK